MIKTLRSTLNVLKPPSCPFSVENGCLVTVVLRKSPRVISRRWCASGVSVELQHTRKPFSYKNLPFSGAEIDCQALNVADGTEFGARLSSTITEAKEKGIGAFYLKVNMPQSHYISIAATFGFKYHHAEGDEAVLMRWLPNSECKVPPSATHHVGVGALLVTEKNEMLVVKEKNKLADWKLPGGYVNLGEDLGVAAAREVFEETGVECEFESMVSGNREITLDDEIQEARWMKVPDFLAQNTHPMHSEIMGDLAIDRESFTNNGWKEVFMDSTIPDKPAFAFYSPKH